MAKKTFTGAVTTAAPLKTFADFFDERGGVLGAIGGKKGGHKAGYWGAADRGKVEMMDGPLGDAGSFTSGSRARTRERRWGHVSGGSRRLPAAAFEEAQGASHQRQDRAQASGVDLGHGCGALDVQHQGRAAQRD